MALARSARAANHSRLEMVSWTARSQGLAMLAPGLAGVSFERLDEAVEGFLVLGHRLGRAGQRDEERVLLRLDHHVEAAIVLLQRLLGARVIRRELVLVGPRDIETNDLRDLAELVFLHLGDVVDRLSLRRDELRLPALDVVSLVAGAERENHQFRIFAVAVGLR